MKYQDKTKEALLTELQKLQQAYNSLKALYDKDIADYKKAEQQLIIANKELAYQNEEKEKRAAELIIANKELTFQNEEKEKRAAELIIANQELAFQNREKEKRADELILANKELVFQNEEKEKRAAELVVANKKLAIQNKEKEKKAEELIIANKELALQNREKEKRADELILANKELAFQNKEKGNRAAELIIANKEHDFQNEEKEKRAAELVVANKKLAIENKEKEKKARELILANNELALQNREKEKRADELILANKELAFQNEEKEKRAAELIIANKELTFQNEEKEKRAAELIIANQELAIHNREKEKRADELILANKELAFQNEEKEKRAAELIIANQELELQYKQVWRLATIIESSEDAIISRSLDGIIISWNKAAEKMFGYDAKQAVGKHISLIIPLEKMDEEVNIMKRICTNEIIGHYETVRIKNGGEQFYVSLAVSPLKDETGNIIGVSTISRDITARKKMEAEVIRKSDELIQANKELAFQNEEKEKRAAELIIANKELAFQNEEKEKRASELIIANQELAFQNREKEKRADELIMANKELAFQNEEKEKRAAELIIANKELAFQNKEKEKRAAELVIADKEVVFQSEEKEKQEVANKELEAFSYSVSHDLRAPLRHIVGFIDLLIKNNSSQLDETGLRYLNIISESTIEMGNLIDALLTFSRLSRTELQRTTIKSKIMVNQVLSTFSDEFAGRDIEVNITELPDIRGDEALIYQVWVNLISNALKYSRNEEKAVIYIGGKVEDDFDVFYIRDNGVGFNMKYADKLFGVFQRLHKSKDFEGIGIGLANVNRIIVRHGGKCWAESEVGNGATFFFSLPNNV